MKRVVSNIISIYLAVSLTVLGVGGFLSIIHIHPPMWQYAFYVVWALAILIPAWFMAIGSLDWQNRKDGMK